MPKEHPTTREGRRQEKRTNYLHGKSRNLEYLQSSPVSHEATESDQGTSGVCPSCSPILSRYADTFKELTHRGSDLKRRKRIYPTPKTPNVEHYRDVKHQNEWLRELVFRELFVLFTLYLQGIRNLWPQAYTSTECEAFHVNWASYSHEQVWCCSETCQLCYYAKVQILLALFTTLYQPLLLFKFQRREWLILRKEKQDQLLVNLTESRKKMGNKDVQMVLHLTGSKNFILRWLYAPTSLTIVTLVRSIRKIYVQNEHKQTAQKSHKYHLQKVERCSTAWKRMS